MILWNVRVSDWDLGSVKDLYFDNPSEADKAVYAMEAVGFKATITAISAE